MSEHESSEVFNARLVVLAVVSVDRGVAAVAAEYLNHVKHEEKEEDGDRDIALSDQEKDDAENEKHDHELEHSGFLLIEIFLRQM